jgi:hypothetical protein
MSGAWYKGALHVHTTRSDGQLAPEEVVRAHHERGYHFLAVTDHETITDLSSFSNGLLTIPAVEVSYGRNSVGEAYHLVMLGAQEMVALPQETPIRSAVERWAGRAGLILMAHPYRTGTTAAEMCQLEGLTGLEIFNNSSQVCLGKGLSTVHWDQLLARGRRCWGYAVDDVHWRRRNGHFYDAFGGWVWVKTRFLDVDHVLEALRRGHFYASNGPKIYDFRIVDGEVRLHCSDVVTINLVSQAHQGLQARAEPGRHINRAYRQLAGDELYVRAECVDDEGKIAWTNPIFL